MMTLGLSAAPCTVKETLCANCIYARIVRGYNAGEELLSCGYAYPPREVPFPVRDCTDFSKQRTKL